MAKEERKAHCAMSLAINPGITKIGSNKSKLMNKKCIGYIRKIRYTIHSKPYYKNLVEKRDWFSLEFFWKCAILKKESLII